MSGFWGYKPNTMGGQFNSSNQPFNIGANLSNQATTGNVTGFVVGTTPPINGVAGIGVPITNKPNYSIGLGASTSFGNVPSSKSYGLSVRWNL